MTWHLSTYATLTGVKGEFVFYLVAILDAFSLGRLSSGWESVVAVLRPQVR